jgi:hypothetical protein
MVPYGCTPSCVLGRGILVGHNAVALLMRRAGLTGAIGRPKWRRLVDRYRADGDAGHQRPRHGNSDPDVTCWGDRPLRPGGAAQVQGVVAHRLGDRVSEVIAGLGRRLIRQCDDRGVLVAMQVELLTGSAGTSMSSWPTRS